MHEMPASDWTRGQHFADCRGFSPGCPLLGALVPRRAFSRSLARAGLGRFRVVWWGRAQSSKRRPYPLNGAGFSSVALPVPLSWRFTRSVNL